MIKNNKKNNIILIGMPGSGKTTIGELLANKLDCKFMDSDQLIFEKTGKLPRKVVEDSGRDFFLNIQDEVVLAIKENKFVLATGGGIVHSTVAMDYLRAIGFIIFLDTEYDIIEKRMDSSRRLVRTNGTLLDLYNERSPLYCKYSDIIIKCDSTDPQLLCNRILKIINTI